jgi:hypothetical protein
MRLVCLILFFFLSAPFAFAQEKEQWQRLLTLEDTTVEMNVSTVVFSTGGIGRVKFRYTLAKAQAVPEMPGLAYKSFIETVEFKCDENLYRLYDRTFIDSQGKALRIDEREASAKWKPTDEKGFRRKLVGTGCNLIQAKRQNP